MNLGGFSNSLAVKDLSVSIDFYTKLGFSVFHDQTEHNWAILKNGDSVIGLFQGMFENNIMTRLYITFVMGSETGMALSRIRIRIRQSFDNRIDTQANISF